MLKDDIGYGPWEFDRLENIVADLGMGLDELVFDGGQLVGLAQNLRRDIDLSKVMDNAGQPETMNLVFGQRHLAADSLCKASNTSLMAGSIGIAHFHGTGDSLHRLFECPRQARDACLMR